MGTIKRFAFIKDENLRKEIDMNYLFIAFIKEKYDNLSPGLNSEVSEAIEFGYKKTIALLISSIIESILLYTIKELELKHKKCFGIKRIQFGDML